LACSAVVGDLGFPPAVQGLDQRGVAGREGEAGAVVEILVGDLDLGGSGFELGQPGHLVAVDLGGVAEVAALEALAFVGEVSADEGDVFDVAGVIGGDVLDQTLDRRRSRPPGNNRCDRAVATSLSQPASERSESGETA
jgi:hypothetical protein